MRLLWTPGVRLDTRRSLVWIPAANLAAAAGYIPNKQFSPQTPSIMLHRILQCSLAALLLHAAAPAGTAEKVSDSNGNLWLNYVGDHPLGSGPWGVHLEVQNRRSDFGDEWQQLLLRPGVNYQISPTLSASLLGAYVRTYPYGDYPVATEFPEYRLAEQLQHTFKLFGLDWVQRLRLEQRWIGEMARDAGGDDYDLENWRYENRIRYMLRTSVPLTGSGRTYLAIWDELFFNFGGNVVGNDFDQNRAFIGIGQKLTANTRVEVGFMEQTLRRRGGLIREDNHTIAVWFMSKWPFARSGE